MTQINWGLAYQPNSFQNALAQGLQFGQHIRQRNEEKERQNALDAYVANPTREAAIGLAQYDAGLAMGEVNRFDQREQAAQRADIQRRAAGGDPAAMAELAGIDLDAWRGLNGDQQKAAAEQMDAMGQAALYVSSLPEEQRAIAWDQQVDQLSRQFPDIAQYRGRYSPEALQGAIASSGSFMDFYRMQQPNYMAIPQGGTLVDTRNPAAVAQFGRQSGQQGGQNNIPSGSPLSQPAPQSNSPIFPINRWNVYADAVGEAFPAIVERDRPVVINSQGVQVQTDVLNGQVVYNVNGIWYDNPEGQ